MRCKMTKSRTHNSIRNTLFSILGQAITVILAFICRTIFIYLLGRTYLGYDGLFSDLLTIFSLAELGIGSAITYSMYQPAAVNNQAKVVALLNLYKRLYSYVGLFISVIGLCTMPFLGYLVSGVPNDANLKLIYLFYLANTVISYFFSYKFTLLTVYQDNYILTILSTVIVILTNLTQILALLLYQNFILYLGIQLFYSLARNLVGTVIINHRYPFIKNYQKEKIPKNELKEIFTNIHAMFYSRISSAIVNSTDNLLISIFVSTISVGFYSNYLLFTNVIRNLLNSIFNSINGSVGNLIVLANKQEIYQSFKRIWFINFWLAAFFTDMFFTLINPFIALWIGKSYQLDTAIVFLICLNLYLRLIRNSFITFNECFGSFVQLKAKCIWETIINLLVSLFYLKICHLGITGVLLGTFTSNLLTNWWVEPLVLYRRIDVNWKEYFIQFNKYFIVTFVLGGVNYFITTNFLAKGSWIGLVLSGLISLLIINLGIVLCFYQTDEFAYVIRLVKRYLPKM